MFIRVEIPGVPVPWSRPRFYGKQAFNAKPYDDYKKYVSLLCNRAVALRRRDGDAPETGPLIPTGPVLVSCQFFMPLPKADHRVRNPPEQKLSCVKPDLDNLIKSLLDGASGWLFTDDNQVARFVKTAKYVCAQGAGPHAFIAAWSP